MSGVMLVCVSHLNEKLLGNGGIVCNFKNFISFVELIDIVFIIFEVYNSHCFIL